MSWRATDRSWRASHPSGSRIYRFDVLGLGSELAAIDINEVLRKTLLAVERTEDFDQDAPAIVELRRNLARIICELEIAKTLRRSETVPSNLIEFKSRKAANIAEPKTPDLDLEQG